MIIFFSIICNECLTQKVPTNVFVGVCAVAGPRVKKVGFFKDCLKTVRIPAFSEIFLLLWLPMVFRIKQCTPTIVS